MIALHEFTAVLNDKHVRVFRAPDARGPHAVAVAIDGVVDGTWSTIETHAHSRALADRVLREVFTSRTLAGDGDLRTDLQELIERVADRG